MGIDGEDQLVGRVFSISGMHASKAFIGFSDTPLL